MKGWLVNDCLTCIPGTYTFWHNLLEWFPDLEDKTDGLTNYKILADKIEKELLIHNPKYIIRNCTYFRPINTNIKTISLLQDICSKKIRNNQINVANKSTVVVCNSEYIKQFYKKRIKTDIRIIPLGIDFDFFKPIKERSQDVLENSIIYIGSSLNNPKGFNHLLDIIRKMKSQNFCLILKDNYNHTNLPDEIKKRVKIFNRIDHKLVRLLINSCICAICTSIQETQHLSGLECGACNIPIVSTDVGLYYDCKNDNEWGYVTNYDDMPNKINYIINNIHDFSPRKYFLNKGYDLQTCKNKWSNLLEFL
jgi:glycosyltransferase involved in cell wall biosynthesis